LKCAGRVISALSFELDPRPGGAHRARMRSPEGGEYSNGGVVREIVEPGRLLFSFAWADESDHEMVIGVTFVEHDGKTEMTFRQSGFKSVESRDGHKEGWNESFDKLAEYLAKESSPSTRTPITVRVTRRFAASAERVFDVWLDPISVGNWLFATPTGEMIRVEIDPRVGGRFVIVERRDGVDAFHVGEYLEIDRPRRLVFSFAVDEQMADASLVRLDIVPLDEGCELTLTHEIDPKFADYLNRTEEGWTNILQGLREVLETQNSSMSAADREAHLRRMSNGPN